VTDSPQALAVIPARGGSKRLPGKNIRPFHGKPALAWTIEAALQSRLFQKVVVSTDDPQVATLARQHGAEVPFLRAAELADDHTPVSRVTLDALQRLDPAACRYSAVAQLMPNCPLRTASDIQDSFRQFTETGTVAQISVTSYAWLNPWWALTRDTNQRLTPLFADRLTQRSQDLPALLCPTGAIWWIQPEILRREKTFHVANRTGWAIPWRHAVDIDTIEDWEMAELFYTAEEIPPGIS
jgi:N-acylneuraminate cytidylyltransferase